MDRLSLSLSDLTMEAFLLLFLVRSSRWPLETRVSFPRARSHFISSAILLRLFLLSLSYSLFSLPFFGSSQAASFESYNSERASFRSRSDETVSSRGYEMIVQRSLSRRRGDLSKREVRRSLDGGERCFSREDRDVWPRWRHLCAGVMSGGEWRG